METLKGLVTDRQMLACLLLMWLLLWQIIHTFVSLARSRKRRRLQAKNDEEHRILRKNQSTIISVIRRVESAIRSDSAEIKRISSTLQTKIYPLLSNDKTVRELTEKLESLESKKDAERILLGELAKSLEEAKRK